MAEFISFEQLKQKNSSKKLEPSNLSEQELEIIQIRQFQSIWQSLLYEYKMNGTIKTKTMIETLAPIFRQAIEKNWFNYDLRNQYLKQLEPYLMDDQRIEKIYQNTIEFEQQHQKQEERNK